MIEPPRSRNNPCPCGSGRRYKHCHGVPNGALTANAVEPADSEAAWRRVLASDPANPEAHFHLGNLLRERGDVAGAALEYRQGLEAAPGNAGLLNNLGLALEASGEREQAERCYRDVLIADPLHPDALGNLASALFEREAFSEAVASYDVMFTVRRDVPAAIWVRRGIAQQRLGALADAEICFREAAAENPDDARILLNLGTVLTELGKYADAEPVFTGALEIAPGNPYVVSMLAYSKQQCCTWDGLDALYAQIARILDDDRAEVSGNINPFTVLSMPVSPRAQLRAAQRWAAGLAPEPAAIRPTVNRRRGERLRVGFVSSDFRGEHPVGRVSVEVFEKLKGNRLETFGYGLLPRDESAAGSRIAQAFEHFNDVSGASTAAIAQRIRDDRIAILLDLNGYTTHDRSRIFAARPAPLQINWLGYSGTLGADWFDGIVTDRFATPADEQIHFTERFLYLPHSLFPTDTRSSAATAAPSRSESGLPPDAFVFCCFGSPYKIQPSVFDVWMRLLARIGDSVLWLSGAPANVVDNLRREASKRGIDPSRLVFATRVLLPQHLARHRHADLFLDTTPYNAHTTANDALWAGVPLITCAGRTMASRLAGSQLHAIGAPELITSSLDEYEALALRLVRAPDERSTLRGRLVANRHELPLFDMARYAQDFADCLIRAWDDHAGASS